MATLHGSTSSQTCSTDAPATGVAGSPPHWARVFNAENQEQARERIGHVIPRLASIAPKVCRLLEQPEEDLIAFYLFPTERWTKLRSTNPLGRLNKEIGRRTDVVGIFPNDAAVNPPHWRPALRAERRVAGPVPLPVCRVDGPDPLRWVV